ncbi:putative profilin protein [Phaeoacremonium minimum UCRPA7]|uniref:Profilin n=1 Tax=Phaeoacremonium minimum (strain UCR-PA7) TaxID=1286976 RepID=R8BBF2_PHAM7|nr:putative profilin protein [Phaeoacremonium minimum UCRPA7]EON96599.1 putative profilin protein [Phaeoacremonium minimum UCRPA7]
MTPPHYPLVGTGHIDKAAIISAAGDSTWASSAGFTLQPAEMKNLVNILNSTGDAVDKAHAEGIHVAGERYVVTRIEERSVYARQGKTGIAVVKTKQAILVGHYGENVQAGNATQTVEALADYLIKVGY